MLKSIVTMKTKRRACTLAFLLACVVFGFGGEDVRRRQSVGNKNDTLILSYSNLKSSGGQATSHSNRTLFEMVRCNHLAYAEKHGYDYHSPYPHSAKWHASMFVLNGIRYKTFSILSFFDDYDVIVWIDHDAVFYDMETTVERWVDEMKTRNSSLLVAADIPGYPFNMGVQVLRTTKWAKELYVRAYAEILHTSPAATYLEQPIFHRMYRLDPAVRKGIQIHTPRHELQAFLKIKGDLTPSSWIAHGTQCKCDLGAFVRPTSCAIASGSRITT